MVSKSYFTKSLLLALFLCFAFPIAAQAISKQQMGLVINLAGKQRMLTQKMSKEAFFIAKGINVEANKASLTKTAALFDKTLKGLINGDADLNLPKTEDPAIAAQLTKVSGLWSNFEKPIQSVAGGTTDAGVLNKIAAQNIPLLKNMNKAVQMYAKSSGSDLDAGMAATINLAGKQRMLTQKMTKELLMLANNIDADNSKKNMAATAALFEKTLNGLLNGDASLGLPGTKDSAIVQQLHIVQKLWGEYKPVLVSADISDAGLSKAEKLNIPLLKEMNKAVKMYEKSIK